MRDKPCDGRGEKRNNGLHYCMKCGRSWRHSGTPRDGERCGQNLKHYDHKIHGSPLPTGYSGPGWYYWAGNQPGLVKVESA